MSRDSEKLYLRRKLGQGMGAEYVLSTFTPLILVFLITTILVFALVFIFSMSSAIDRMIALLGSGSLSSDVYVDPSLLPDNSSVDEVMHSEGIFYSANGESIVYIRGVGEDYFNQERVKGLRLEVGEYKKNWVVLSSNLAKSLDCKIGDKMTMLLYEEEKGRTRPYLVNVIGIFDSGYAQIDRYMAFVSKDVLSNENSEYEILLQSDANVEDVKAKLLDEGIYTTTYKENNALLYSNVEQSIWILYVIIVLVAFLSAFFSIEVSQVYLSRDRRDIATLLLLGMERKRVRAIYVKMTLVAISIATFIGVIVGLLLGLLSPRIISLISRFEPEMLEYYITSFSISIPYVQIAIMIALMILIAYLSLLVTLKHREKKELLSEVYNM